MNLHLVLKHLLSRFATKLPVGASEFETWADDIIELSGPYADRDSMLFAIASILIHADAKHGSLPKKYFVDRLRKSAANQVASQVFQDIKSKQQAAQQVAAEEAKTQAEGSAALVEATQQNGKENQRI